MFRIIMEIVLNGIKIEVKATAEMKEVVICKHCGGKFCPFEIKELFEASPREGERAIPAEKKKIIEEANFRLGKVCYRCYCEI